MVKTVECAFPSVAVFVVVVEGVSVFVCLAVELTIVVLVAPYTGFLMYAAHNS